MNRVEKWLLITAINRWLKRVAEGKEGPMLQSMLSKFVTNKGPIGLFLCTVGSGLAAGGTGKIHQVGLALIGAGTYLAGSGFHASDDAKKVELGLMPETKGGLVKQ